MHLLLNVNRATNHSVNPTLKEAVTEVTVYVQANFPNDRRKLTLRDGAAQSNGILS